MAVVNSSSEIPGDMIHIVIFGNDEEQKGTIITKMVCEEYDKPMTLGAAPILAKKMDTRKVFSGSLQKILSMG